MQAFPPEMLFETVGEYVGRQAWGLRSEKRDVDCVQKRDRGRTRRLTERIVSLSKLQNFSRFSMLQSAKRCEQHCGAEVVEFESLSIHLASASTRSRLKSTRGK